MFPRRQPLPWVLCGPAYGSAEPAVPRHLTCGLDLPRDRMTCKTLLLPALLREIATSRAGFVASSRGSGWALRSRLLKPIRVVARMIEPPRQHHYPLPPSTDHRGRRGPEQLDHGDQASGRELPKRRELQGRDLLLLRRFTALPMKFPEEPKIIPFLAVFVPFPLLVMVVGIFLP